MASICGLGRPVFARSHMSLRKMSVGLGFRPRGTIPSFHLVPIVPAGRSFYLKIQFL